MRRWRPASRGMQIARLFKMAQPRRSITVVAMAACCCLAESALSSPPHVSLVAGAADLKPLAACIESRASTSGPVTSADRLAEGLEFRLTLSAQFEEPDVLIVDSLLKPDVADLVAARDHDDDPEAQTASARRFERLLRIPLSSRAWVWKEGRVAAICSDVADWIIRSRARPILLDRLSPADE